MLHVIKHQFHYTYNYTVNSSEFIVVRGYTVKCNVLKSSENPLLVVVSLKLEVVESVKASDSSLVKALRYSLKRF